MRRCVGWAGILWRLSIPSMMLCGCAHIDLKDPAVLVYPKMGIHYGHTYYGVEIKGTTR